MSFFFQNIEGWQSPAIQEILPGLGLSSFMAVDPPTRAIAQGWQAFLNVSEFDYSLFLGESTPYRQFLMVDGPSCPIGELTCALETLETWRSRGFRVLVHCHAGVSRSPSIIALYLIRNHRNLLNATQRNPVPAQFRRNHEWLDDPRRAEGVGMSTDVLTDNRFRLVIRAFEFISRRRPFVIIRPMMWNSIFHEVAPLIDGVSPQTVDTDH